MYYLYKCPWDNYIVLDVDAFTVSSSNVNRSCVSSEVRRVCVCLKCQQENYNNEKEILLMLFLLFRERSLCLPSGLRAFAFVGVRS